MSWPVGRESPSATMISGAAATTLGPPTCGATARSTPRISAGLAPASSAFATCHRYEAGGASTAGDRTQHAQDLRRAGPGIQCVRDLPQVRGGWGVHGDQGRDLDQAEGAGIQPAALLQGLAQLQHLAEDLHVAQGQAS